MRRLKIITDNPSDRAQYTIPESVSTSGLLFPEIITYVYEK